MYKRQVYGDGTNVRDWLYVEDHCKAIDLVIHKGRAGEVYNVGGHNERPNIVIVKTILEYVKENVDPAVGEHMMKHVADRKGHDRRYGIDPEKIKRDLGWYPETTFEVGIKKTIRDYGIDEADFLARLDEMVEQAFDDQCTGANPRYPLMKEMRQMYLNAYYGTHEPV